MNPDDRALVVVLRQAQWLLDDAAHEIPGDRYSARKQHELADILTRLAHLVRLRAEQRVVIDAETAATGSQAHDTDERRT